MSLKTKILIGILVIGIILIGKWFILNNLFAEEKAHVISNKIRESTMMSYRIGGGYSPLKYAEVTIAGDGKAICSFHLHPYNEIKEEFNLSENVIRDFIKKYEEMDFFNITIEDILVIDIGRTTISYQVSEKKKTISYIGTYNQKLKELSSMYWRIISQRIYILRLKNFRAEDIGKIDSGLSLLSAEIEKNEILEPEIFMPILMEMMLDKELWKKYSYINECLTKITGRDYNFLGSIPREIEDSEDYRYRYESSSWQEWWQANKGRFLYE